MCSYSGLGYSWDAAPNPAKRRAANLLRYDEGTLGTMRVSPSNSHKGNQFPLTPSSQRFVLHLKSFCKAFQKARILKVFCFRVDYYWRNRLKREEIKIFIKFCIVGLANSIVSTVVFWLCTKLSLPTILCSIISYVAGMLNSWILNSLWTFKQSNKSNKQKIYFVIVNFCAWLVSTAIIMFLTGELSFLSSNVYINNKTIAQIIATPFSVIVNFVGNRLLVFKKEKE